jgi:hypothetical protein
MVTLASYSSDRLSISVAFSQAQSPSGSLGTYQRSPPESRNRAPSQRSVSRVSGWVAQVMVQAQSGSSWVMRICPRCSRQTQSQGRCHGGG